MDAAGRRAPPLTQGGWEPLYVHSRPKINHDHANFLIYKGFLYDFYASHCHFLPQETNRSNKKNHYSSKIGQGPSYLGPDCMCQWVCIFLSSCVCVPCAALLYVETGILPCMTLQNVDAVCNIFILNTLNPSKHISCRPVGTNITAAKTKNCRWRSKGSNWNIMCEHWSQTGTKMLRLRLKKPTSIYCYSLCFSGTFHS